MAKKKDKISSVKITRDLMKNPKNFIQKLKNEIPDLKYTKVIQTYICEDKPTKIQLYKEGKSFMQGDLVWVSKADNKKEGTVICFKNDKSGDLIKISPSEDNSKEIELDTNKNILKINTFSRIKCPICNKMIEIMDEELQCPICESKGHANHFRDWVLKQKNCPVCNNGLALDKQGNLIALDE